ncbi:YdcH family protein [Maribius pontilimi]|uniref:YdcH family protein n=1 Tax=Palleronia pontilimi TaxID=1964209 RepID=A0A934ICF4_9RHOB|nr:YdcH family protein [Palleronia pontilimi]MBJ3764589.1 YdcH family protein [Palleronia pontilimi]
MKVTSARKRPSIMARVENLHRRRGELSARIYAELRRPAPCSMTLQTLKRERLRLKDEIARFDGLLRRSNTHSSLFPAA